MPPRALHFGLLGWPVQHSLSPGMHQAALAALDLAGEYRLFPVPELPVGDLAERLAQLVSGLRRGELDGLNVTLPYKTTVLPLADRLSDSARAIGAANLLARVAGEVVADNSDAPGFLTDLQTQFPSLFEPPKKTPPTALVLGAGGAARAVVYALLGLGWQVFIAARRREQAERLAQSLSPQAACASLSTLALDSASLRDLSARVALRLVVNATPLGMSPHPDQTPWPEEVPLPDQVVVYDLVYNPPETRLVRSARAAGLPSAGGSGMLLEQAVLSFERWTSLPAPRPAMRAALEKGLAGL